MSNPQLVTKKVNKNTEPKQKYHQEIILSASYWWTA